MPDNDEFDQQQNNDHNHKDEAFEVFGKKKCYFEEHSKSQKKKKKKKNRTTSSNQHYYDDTQKNITNKRNDVALIADCRTGLLAEEQELPTTSSSSSKKGIKLFLQRNSRLRSMTSRHMVEMKNKLKRLVPCHRHMKFTKLSRVRSYATSTKDEAKHPETLSSCLQFVSPVDEASLRMEFIDEEKAGVGRVGVDTLTCSGCDYKKEENVAESSKVIVDSDDSMELLC